MSDFFSLLIKHVKINNIEAPKQPKVKWEGSKTSTSKETADESVQISNAADIDIDTEQFEIAPARRNYATGTAPAAARQNVAATRGAQDERQTIFNNVTSTNLSYEEKVKILNGISAESGYDFSDLLVDYQQKNPELTGASSSQNENNNVNNNPQNTNDVNNQNSVTESQPANNNPVENNQESYEDGGIRTRDKNEKPTAGFEISDKVKDYIKNKYGDVSYEEINNCYIVKTSTGTDLYISIGSEGELRIEDRTNPFKVVETGFYEDGSEWYENVNYSSVGFFDTFMKEMQGPESERKYFPNGIDDVKEYFNQFPAEMTIKIITAMLEDTKNIENQDLKQSYLSNFKSGVDFLKSALESGGLKFYEALEGVIADMLDKEGQSDLLRVLYGSAEYNEDVVSQILNNSYERLWHSVGDDDDWNANGNNFDSGANQGSTGDCWFLASLHGAADNEEMNEVIKSMVEIDENNKIYTIKLPGREPIAFTFDEIKRAGELSNGDYDVRAFEMAVRQAMAEYGEGVSGGNIGDFLTVLLGKVDGLDFGKMGSSNYSELIYTWFNDMNNDQLSQEDILKQIKSGDYLLYASARNESYAKYIKVTDMDGNPIEGGFIAKHAYTIVSADDDYVYLINPHNGEQQIRISVSDFKNYIGYQSLNVKNTIELMKAAQKGPDQVKEVMQSFNQLSVNEYKTINGQEVKTKTIYRDMEGNIKKEEQYEYDEKGNNIGATTYSYDKNGNCLKETEIRFDSKGYVSYESECKTTYDENGNVTGSVSIETKYKDGRVSAENTIEYDNNGKIISRALKSNTYDDKGKLKNSAHIIYDGESDNPSSVYQTNIDKHGNSITAKIDIKNGKGEVARTVVDKNGNTYEFAGEGGNLVLVSATDKDGNDITEKYVQDLANNEVRVNNLNEISDRITAGYYGTGTNFRSDLLTKDWVAAGGTHISVNKNDINDVYDMLQSGKSLDEIEDELKKKNDGRKNSSNNNSNNSNSSNSSYTSSTSYYSQNSSYTNSYNSNWGSSGPMAYGYDENGMESWSHDYTTVNDLWGKSHYAKDHIDNTINTGQKDYNSVQARY